MRQPLSVNDGKGRDMQAKGRWFSGRRLEINETIRKRVFVVVLSI
jgi:hypothetical protein